MITSFYALNVMENANQMQQENIQIKEKSLPRDTLRIELSDEIMKRIIKIIAKHHSSNLSKIINKTNYRNDLGFDSLDIVEIIIDLEKEFEIRIDNQTSVKIQTLGQTVDVVNNLLFKKR